MASHEFSIPLLCDVIGLARSSFYYKSQRSDDSELRSDIEGVCLRYTRYGYRRVLGRLQRKGYAVGHNRVNRLMGEMYLSVRPRRRKIRTTRSDGSHPKYPNLLKGLAVIRPDQVWCADITYIPLANSRTVYLAFLIDVFTRMVRGWYLSRGMSEELTQEALTRALSTGHQPEIHHSDRGSQYTAHGYCKTVASLGAQISMSAKGKAWENPYAESVIGHIKDEEVWTKEYVDFQDALSNLGHFLDVEYNHHRIHSALDYLTPAEFEARYEEQE